MSRIVADSFDLGELFHHGPEDAAIALLKGAGVVAVMVWIDPPLAAIVLALVPLAGLHALHFNARMNRAVARSAEGIAAVNERVEDSLTGIRVVQSFAAEAAEGRRFDALNAAFLDSRRAGYRAEGLFSIGIDAFPQLATILVIVAGAGRVMTGGLGLGDLAAFLLATALLLDPVARIANVARVWQAGITGYLRMAEILEEEPEVADRPGAVVLTAPRGAVAFERVRFRYSSGDEVLRGLSLSVRPGELVALVGASGAGKSTLCALVPRFYDVSAGRVTVDGTDVRDLSLASLRRAVAVVQQDVQLFAGTVAENLRLARAEATDAEVEAAARAAHAHDFVMSLPRGYGTEIGQRGVRLSGGQRQRLTLARAFLKDAPMLILDEATSALDAESEALVQQGLLRLARGRTTLVIAHRLSTIRHADRIVVLEAGRVVEEGTHAALLAGGGAYEALVRAQARL
jgi:ATP-binding cassette, subfamily B, bacterial